MSALGAQLRVALRPPIAGGIVEIRRSGGGERIEVLRASEFEAWVRSTYPAFDGQLTVPDGASRAAALAFRRNTKSAGAGVASSIVHLRALGSVALIVDLDGRPFPVGELTEAYGVAACLIADDSRMRASGRVVVVENLECFLRVESILPSATLSVFSGGRLSERLIGFLTRSTFDAPPIVHLPDYDPVGLSDYLRLRAALSDRVALWVPDDLEERFHRFSNRDLITRKPRNRELLESLASTTWPCAASSRVFELIKEHGAGLEQEALLVATLSAEENSPRTFPVLPDA